MPADVGLLTRCPLFASTTGSLLTFPINMAPCATAMQKSGTCLSLIASEIRPLAFSLMKKAASRLPTGSNIG